MWVCYWTDNTSRCVNHTLKYECFNSLSSLMGCPLLFNLIALERKIISAGKTEQIKAAPYECPVIWKLPCVSCNFLYIWTDASIGTFREGSLKDAATTAYGQVCAPFHNWAIRQAVGAGMYALPTRDQLISRLNETGKLLRLPVLYLSKLISEAQAFYLNSVHLLHYMLVWYGCETSASIC